MPEIMICPNCKSEIPSGLKVCNSCGSNLQADPSAGKQPGKNKEKQASKKSKIWIWVLSSIGFCLICGLLFASLYAIAVLIGINLPYPFVINPPLNQEQVIETAWQALEPNTHSHNQSSWEVTVVQLVSGQEVQDQFGGEPAPGCLGPTPQENKRIDPGGSYWYVEMRPIYATPQPEPEGQYSPTAPPIIPEPFIQKAQFLIDAVTGEVTARQLFCVIY